jgi:hypothetical protein
LIRRRLAHQEVGENICQRSALSFIDPDQDQHFQDPDWKPYEYEDYHSAKGQPLASTFFNCSGSAYGYWYFTPLGISVVVKIVGL